MTKAKFVPAIILVLVLAVSVAGVDQLISLQGKVTLNGWLVNDGNVLVKIYDAADAGNLLYDSGTSFNNQVQNGIFDIMLGSQTTLDLNYNQYYYLDMSINGVDIDWNGLERKKFESTSGDTMSSDLKLESGTLRVCSSDDLCIKIEQTPTNANISTNTGNIYIDPDGNNIYLNGKTMASSSLTIGTYLTVQGGRISLNGTASAGDIYQDSNTDIVIDPEGGDIILILG